MKTLSTIAVVILLGLTGTAMANDSGENHQDNTNATGPNPYVNFRGGNYRAGGYEAFGQQTVPHHIVKHHVKK